MAETRTLCVRFVRDATKDAEKGDIQYSGFTFTWPDGRPIQTGLEKLCQRGTKLFFGKEGLQKDTALLKIVSVPVNEQDPITKIPATKVRRFYLLRQGDLGTVYFMQGIITDVVFDVTKEEPEVLQWIGLTPELKDGDKYWFDIYALPEEKPLESFPAIQNSSQYTEILSNS